MASFRLFDWDNHLKMCRHTRGFQRRYGIPEQSFHKLVSILRADLQANELQSIRSGGADPLTPDIIVAIGLRSLGGSFTQDIAEIFGMSKTTAHNKIYSFLHAVDKHLNINVPMTDEEREAVLSEIKTRMKLRPDRNLARNNELDDDSDY